MLRTRGYFDNPFLGVEYYVYRIAAASELLRKYWIHYAATSSKDELPDIRMAHTTLTGCHRGAQQDRAVHLDVDETAEASMESSVARGG
jgi:hypothetical protein